MGGKFLGLDLYKLVFAAADAELSGGLNGVGAIAALNALYKVVAPGVVRGVHQINAGLVDGHRVERGQNADILHAGVLGSGAAIAVDGEVLHHVYKHRVVTKIVFHGPCRVRHGVEKTQLLLVVADLAYAVDKLLAVRGGRLK